MWKYILSFLIIITISGHEAAAIFDDRAIAIEGTYGGFVLALPERNSESDVFTDFSAELLNTEPQFSFIPYFTDYNSDLLEYQELGLKIGGSAFER